MTPGIGKREGIFPGADGKRRLAKIRPVGRAAVEPIALVIEGLKGRLSVALLPSNGKQLKERVPCPGAAVREAGQVVHVANGGRFPGDSCHGRNGPLNQLISQSNGKGQGIRILPEIVEDEADGDCAGSTSQDIKPAEFS